MVGCLPGCNLYNSMWRFCGPGLCEHVDSGDHLMPALCLCPAARAHYCSGLSAPHLTHFLDIAFDLEINVDDQLLSLWLLGRGPAECAVQGALAAALPPLLFG